MEVISVNKSLYFMNICGLDSLSLEIIAKLFLNKDGLISLSRSISDFKT